MKWIIILLLVSSCASTEKLLNSNKKQEVVRIEEKRFARKNLPRKNEYMVYTFALFLGYSIIANTRE